MAIYTGEAEALRQLLDALPIYATKIGYRTDATEADREFADAVLKLADRWTELRADLAVGQ